MRFCPGEAVMSDEQPSPTQTPEANEHDQRLRDLTTEAKAWYRKGRKRSLEAAEAWLNLGRVLLTLKEDVVPYGEWGKYIKKNYEFELRMAEYYIEAYELGVESQSIATLGLVGAIRKTKRDRKPAKEEIGKAGGGNGADSPGTDDGAPDENAEEAGTEGDGAGNAGDAEEQESKPRAQAATTHSETREGQLGDSGAEDLGPVVN
jgi:hypothetical protein